MSWRIPSMRTTRPDVMHVVSCCTHLGWFIDIIMTSPWFLPRIHVDPCSYGSMRSGHLVQALMIDAFSKDIGSTGSPSFFHLEIITSVARIFNGWTLSEMGIALSLMSFSQVSFHNSTRSFAENAPIYEVNAEARRESPIVELMLPVRTFTLSVHRLFSPSSPWTRFSAALSRV